MIIPRLRSFPDLNCMWDCYSFADIAQCTYTIPRQMAFLVTHLLAFLYPRELALTCHLLNSSLGTGASGDFWFHEILRLGGGRRKWKFHIVRMQSLNQEISLSLVLKIIHNRPTFINWHVTVSLYYGMTIIWKFPSGFTFRPSFNYFCTKHIRDWCSQSKFHLNFNEPNTIPAAPPWIQSLKEQQCQYAHY